MDIPTPNPMPPQAVPPPSPTSPPWGRFFSDAFRIAWRHKVLWFFGLLAAGSGAPNFPTSYSNSRDGGESMREFLEKTTTALQNVPLEVVIPIAVLAGLFFMFVFIFLNVISRGALLTGLRDARLGLTHSFGEHWRAGWGLKGRVFRLVMIQFAVGLTFGILIVLIIGAGVLIGIASEWYVGLIVGLGLGALLGLPAMILLIGAFLALVVGERYLVFGDNPSAIQAFRDGWSWWRGHWSDLLLTSLLSWCGQVLILIGSLILLLPLILVGVGMCIAEQWLLLGLVVLLSLPILLVIAGFVGTWKYSLWTEMFAWFEPRYMVHHLQQTPSNDPA